MSSDLLRTRFNDVAGGSVVIGDELGTGKRVTLVFWQAWCAPCRAEAPQLAAASRKYPNLEIIGVVSGPDESVDAALLQSTIVELALPYRNVRDRALDLTHAFDVRGTPTIVVLGPKGEVLYRGHESPDWDKLL
jgi:thiol-disulfide isomerase/thioredoxin